MVWAFLLPKINKIEIEAGIAAGSRGKFKQQKDIAITQEPHITKPFCDQYAREGNRLILTGHSKNLIKFP